MPHLPGPRPARVHSPKLTHLLLDDEVVVKVAGMERSSGQVLTDEVEHALGSYNRLLCLDLCRLPGGRPTGNSIGVAGRNYLYSRRCEMLVQRAPSFSEQLSLLWGIGRI